ncbi:MAG: HK97 family phage prohead protease [Butyricicoccus porcorum]|nr:HK97 family phage prohead protease [Butyricicoccus porcorum]
MTKNERRAYQMSGLHTRDDSGTDDPIIEGYFAVFGQETEIWPGWFESIAPGAFANSLRNNDIRCLFDHDSANVLGRTSAGTLTLKEDDHGLFGQLHVNPDDRMAMDVYARVRRGDISGCSFGFFPISEECETKDDGDHYVVREADTIEVSVCTFPAYPTTEIDARKAAAADNRRKRTQAQRKRLEAYKKCLHS